MSLRIGIDGLPLQIPGNRTGVYQYTWRLLDNLQQIDRENAYELLFFSCRDRASRELVASYRFQANFRKCLYRAPYRLVHALGEYAPFLASLGGCFDVYHGPAFRLLPKAYYKKSVATVHDINFLKHPELFPDPRGLENYRRETAYAVQHADVLLTVSNFTRDEVMQAYRIGSDRIRVIYPGIGEEFHDRHDARVLQAMQDRLGIRGPYLLFVGLQEPKKNLLRLLRAFAQARSEFARPHQLVLAGAPGPDTDAIRKLIAELNLGDDVKLAGHVARGDLPLLYAAAAAFVFPSLYEGFGIPVLEAMASATPVITSNVASLPEVVGDAGYLVNPLVVDDLAHAMVRLLADSEGTERLVARGLARARYFSWLNMAEQTLQLYRDL